MGLIGPNTNTLQHPPQSKHPAQRSLELDNKENITPTPPAVPTLATADVETGPKLAEHRGREALGEDIGELRRRWYVKNPNVSNGNPLPDEVEVDLNMLRALVLDGVGGELHSADVVAVNEGAPTKRLVELEEELAQPGRLGHAVSHGAVLSLSTRARDHGLPLG